MIVSCPSCGTHYKHPAPTPRAGARARCGACASTVDLSTLRPYRIVSVAAADAADVRRASAHLPIGLDEPGLATAIVANVGDAPAKPLVPATSWDESEALPAIPEMMNAASEFDLDAPAAETESAAEAVEGFEAAPAESRAPIYAFWAGGGAIVGTGTSWTLGGTTLEGVAAGALVGTIAAWGWLRWTSRQ